MPTGARSARSPPARCPRRWATRSPWASCTRAPPRSAPSWWPTCAARTCRSASWRRPSAPATDLPPPSHHENLRPPGRTIPMSADLLYSKDHEWVRVESEGVAIVGVTDYAAEQLGDVVYVDLPEGDDEISAGTEMGEIESTKSVSDLFSPRIGPITAAHQAVVDSQGVAIVAVTDYAAEQIGDVVYVDLPEVDDEIPDGTEMGEIESTKSVSDLFSPLSGTITEVNQAVVDSPELVNSSPFEEGWLVRISYETLPDDLMNAADYTAFTQS